MSILASHSPQSHQEASEHHPEKADPVPANGFQTCRSPSALSDRRILRIAHIDSSEPRTHMCFHRSSALDTGLVDR